MSGAAEHIVASCEEMTSSKTQAQTDTRSSVLQNGYQGVLPKVVILLAVSYLLAYVWISVNRFHTPYELEWMEGGMIAHALRLAAGLPIYAPPSLEFVPFFYTPGYPLLLHLLGSLCDGISFPLARSISIVSSIGVMSLIYWSIWRETHKHYNALLGVGIFAALFRTSGAFYDLARPDSLMLLFLCATIVLARHARHLLSVICCAVLMSIAFFTKQTAAVYFPVIGIWLLWKQLRLGTVFIFVTISLCSIATVILNDQTDGWFWSYIFDGHQGHKFYWKNILLKYWRDLIFLAPITLLLPLLWFRHFTPYRFLTWILGFHWLAAFTQRAMTLDYPPHMYYRELFYEHPRALIMIPPIAITLCLYFARGRRLDHASQTKMSPYWLFIFIAGAGASGLNHSTQWAYSNCFMLLALSIALALPLMIDDLLSICLTWRPRSHLGIWSALALQLIAWGYSPQAQVPTDRDLSAWHRLKDQLENIPTPLLYPGHPTYNQLDRQDKSLHSLHTHQMGINDVAYRGGLSDLRQHLGLKRQQPTWKAVLLNDRVHFPYLDQGYYEAIHWSYLKHHTLRAKTGFLTRPSSLWLPRKADAQARWLDQSQSVLANFEQVSSQELSQLGWHVTGLAFQQALICPRSWKGEGRCGLSNGAPKQLGSIHSSFILPPDAHLSLLVRTQQRETPQVPRLEIQLSLLDRLDTKSQPVAMLSRVSLHTQGRWRRVMIIPPRSQIERVVRLSIIDQDHSAKLWFDDLRIGFPLDH